MTSIRPRGATPATPAVDLADAGPDIGLRELQATIRATYGERDRDRGVDAAMGWLVEELGELSRAIRRQGHEERVEEFSDVVAWVLTLADLTGVDVAEAMVRYRNGCPRCSEKPCQCH